MSSTFAARTPRGEPATFSRAGGGVASLRDVMDQLDNPNTLPGPPPTHFFPSVPRAQRDKARAARLASTSVSPPPHPTDTPSHSYADGAPPPVPVKDVEMLRSSPELASGGSGEDEHALFDRQRQAKVELARAGPFDNRRPSSVESFASSQASRIIPVFPVEKSVGNGGSGGTKRRHRPSDRTSWDAASELVRGERESELSQRGAKRPLEEDGEKTPTPSVAASFGGPRPVVARNSVMLDGSETYASASPEASQRRGSAPSIHSTTSAAVEEDSGDEGDSMAVDDASIRSGASGGSKATGAEGSGKEPAKKRSRTLTTPAQTAVLNALLAKTRFPSTETREDVGKQIGMSARRVQIWFQNRRQSQKRQRDRDAQDPVPAGHEHSLPPTQQQQPVFQHPYAAFAHIDPYSSRNPHLYAAHQPKPQGAPSPYGHLPLHPSSRPELMHRASMDSLASRVSYASQAPSQHSGISSHQALSTHGSERDGLAPLPSDARYAHGGYGYPSNAYSNRQPQHQHLTPHPSEMGQHPGFAHQRQQQMAMHIPQKLYFPHVSRSQPSGPHGRVVVEQGLMSPTAMGGSSDGQRTSLSALLSGPPPQPQHQYHQEPQQQAQPPPRTHAPNPSVPVEHQHMFSHSPFSPPPSHTPLPSHARLPSAPLSALPASSRALFSPEPSVSFERLRISSGMFSPPPASVGAQDPFVQPSPSTGGTGSKPSSADSAVDVLDAAVETMAYRSSRHLPARQTLPPLRSVLGDAQMDGRKRNKGQKSEADKALLAPILPSLSATIDSSAPPRLAPISTFAPLTAPSPPSTAIPASPLSPASSTSPYPLSSGPAVSLRASTWSDHSAATRSTADFDFAHPPPLSSRELQQQQHYQQQQRRGSGGSSANGWASLVAASKVHGGGQRGSTAGSMATSARTSVSSEAGQPK